MFILQGVREKIVKLLMAAIKGDNVVCLKQNFFNYDHPGEAGTALTCHWANLVENTLCGGLQSLMGSFALTFLDQL